VQQGKHYPSGQVRGNLSSKPPGLTAKLRLAIENAPALIWIREPGGNISYVNQAWRSYTGQEENLPDATSFFEFFHPDDMGKRFHEWLTSEERRKPFQMELRMRRSDGAYRWHLVRLEPVKQKGTPLVCWSGICVDVDDQHRSTEALQFLSSAGDALATSLDLKTTLRRVTELAVPHIADWCALFILHAEKLETAAFAHHDPEQRAIGASLAERYKHKPDNHITRVMQTGETIFLPTITPSVIEELAQDEEHLRLLQAFDMTSVILTPLRSRGRVVGLLQLIMQNGRRTYTQAELRVAQDLARRAAMAIENARLYEREQRTTQQLRFLADASLALAESLDLDKRLERLIAVIVPQIGAWASVNLLSPNGSLQTVAIAHRNPDLTSVIGALRGPYYGKSGGENNVMQDVLRNGNTHVIPETDDAFLRHTIRTEKLLVIRALGAHSAVFIPLKVQGRVLGSLSVMRTHDQPPFNDGDLPLLEELARRAAIAIDNAQMYIREQLVADTFQAASLPAPLPSSPGLAFSGYYEPGRTEALIGGDWYDALRLPDGRVLVSIGDVSGSGLQASIIMGSVRQVIRGVAHVTTDPTAILEAADKALQSQYPDRLVTAFVGIVDPIARTLCHASAGHPPPLLRHADASIEELGGCSGLPLGLRSDEEPAVTLQLHEGDLLVMYTDGLIESTRDIFDGFARLRGAIEKTQPTGNRDLAHTIASRALHNIPGDSYSDDIAVLTVHIRSIVNDDLDARRRARTVQGTTPLEENKTF
jgi:PAS domain S-box-containing protein